MNSERYQPPLVKGEYVVVIDGERFGQIGKIAYYGESGNYGVELVRDGSVGPFAHDQIRRFVPSLTLYFDAALAQKYATRCPHKAGSASD